MTYYILAEVFASLFSKSEWGLGQRPKVLTKKDSPLCFKRRISKNFILNFYVIHYLTVFTSSKVLSIVSDGFSVNTEKT